MANPQRENGYTGIANEIMIALSRTQLSGYEWRYLMALFRMTYGFHKKRDWVSHNLLVKLTGLRRQHVWRTEKKLLEKNIVQKKDKLIGFQKNYHKWNVTNSGYKPVTKSGINVTDIGYNNVTNSGTDVTNLGTNVTKSGSHKRNYTKETIQNIDNSVGESENSQPFKWEKEEKRQKPIDRKLARLLGNLIKEEQPNNKDVKKQEECDYVKWGKHIRLMREQDKRTPDGIRQIIKWCQQNNFWQTVILSTRNLRDKYDKIERQMLNKKQQQTPQPQYDKDLTINKNKTK